MHFQHIFPLIADYRLLSAGSKEASIGTCLLSTENKAHAEGSRWIDWDRTDGKQRLYEAQT